MAILVILVLVGAATGAVAEDDATALKALAAEAGAASADLDFARLAALVAPSERPLMAYSVDVIASLAVGFSDEPEVLEPRYREILTKYGLERLADEDQGPPPDIGPEEFDQYMRDQAQAIFAGVDTVAFVGDMMEFAATSFDNPPELGAQQGELADIVVDGDTATGTIDGQPIRFVRDDGRWYLSGDILGG